MKESPLKWVLIFSEGLFSFFYASGFSQDIDEPKMRQNYFNLPQNLKINSI